MPERIQLSRRKGWRMPPNTVKVARGTWLGNPFRVYEHCKGPNGDWGIVDSGRFDAPMTHGWTRAGAHKFAVDAYRQAFDEHFPPGSASRALVVQELTGKNIACWCPPELPCHGDFLLEVANPS